MAHCSSPATALKKNDKDTLFSKIFTKSFKPKLFSKLANTAFTERFNRNALAFILNNYEDVIAKCRPDARNELALDKYYFKSNSVDDITGELGVTYKQNHASSMKGRYQAVNSVSGQAMIREVRHTIFDGYYVDLDIDNAHPVIQLWLCNNVGIKCEQLCYYVNHRDEVFKDLMDLNPGMSRDDAKKLFLTINYGGSKMYEKVKFKNDFLKAYFKESVDLKKQLCDIFTLFRDTTMKLRHASNKMYNELGAAVSHLCCFVENQLLMIIYDHIRSKIGDAAEQCILCFDGIMIPQDDYDSSFIIELESLFQSMLINIKLSIKGFKPLNLTEFGYDSNKIYTYTDQTKERSISKSIPSICDARVTDSFIDYLKLQSRLCTSDDLMDFVKNNIAFIADGGLSVYITKNFINSNDIKYTALSASEAKKSFKEICFNVNDRDFDNLWKVVMHCRSAITYSHRDFIPYGARGDPWDYSSLIFNTFSGFIHNYESEFIVDLSKIERFREHILKVWADSNLEMAECLEKWFAHILQKPDIKTETCIVLSGQEGIGKNIIIDIIKNSVLGAKYILEVPDMAVLTQRFNTALENKLLTVLNEAASVVSSEMKNQDILKDLITEKSRLIEPKGKASYRINDRNNYICFSNNEYVIKSSTEMRRFVLLRGSNHFIGNTEHFTELLKDFSERDAGIHLYHYLMNIDISNFKPQRDFPSTEMKDDLRAEAICKVDKFIIDIINGHQTNIEDDIFISSRTIFSEFNKWLDLNKDRSQYTLIRFSKELRMIMDEPIRRTVSKVKSNGYIFNSNSVKESIIRKYNRDDLFD